MKHSNQFYISITLGNIRNRKGFRYLQRYRNVTSGKDELTCYNPIQKHLPISSLLVSI